MDKNTSRQQTAPDRPARKGAPRPSSSPIRLKATIAADDTVALGSQATAISTDPLRTTGLPDLIKPNVEKEP